MSFCYRAYDLLTQCCGCGYKVTVEVLYLDAEKEPDFMSESRKAKINTEKERKKNVKVYFFLSSVFVELKNFSLLSIRKYYKNLDFP
jgi:hypothetical protein